MIDHLQLRNFKAFAHLELRLAPMTLLSGLNAAGKSTIMQALAVLRQSHATGSPEEDGLLLNGELVELGTGQDVLHEDYQAGTHGPTIGIALREDGLEYGWSWRYDDAEADLLTLAPRSTPPAGRLSLFGPGFQYLHADRIIPATYYPKSYEVAIRRGFLGVHGEHAVNYLRVHQDDMVEQTAVHHPKEPSLSLLKQVNAWMAELCPEVDLQVEEIRGTDFVRLRYRFFGTAGLQSTNPYRPTNVGFGLTYTLPIVVACLTARPGSVVMLENPEAHLHPRGQTVIGRLAALTASIGVQVLVETHSDHVLNAVRLSVKEGVLAPATAAVHYFKRDARRPGRDDHVAISVVTPEINAEGRLSEWPTGFFDEWDQSLDQLLS